MSTQSARPVLVTAVGAIAAISAVTGSVVSAASPSKSSAGRYAFSGEAFGSRVHATPLIDSGRSARVTLGCTIRSGIKKANQTEHAQTSALGQVGSATTSTATRHASGSSAASVSSSTIHGFNLFGGALQATAIKATSTVTNAASQDLGTTTFTNLRIDGHLVDSTPKPNQTYNLKGIGRLVLNAQKSSMGEGSSSLTVNGLDLTLARNNAAGLPAASHLILAHATSAIHPVGYLPLYGSGYGSAVLHNGTVESGRTFAQPMPCAGTDGKTASNSGAGVAKNSAVHTGNVVSIASGSNSATGSLGTTGSSIHHVKLFGGLVTARAIIARAHVVAGNSAVTTSEQGSRFAGLVVAGKKIPANVKPNTRISLGSLGTLWLNRVIRTSQGIAVHMIDLHLKKAKDGIDSGSDVVVANAQTGVRH